MKKYKKYKKSNKKPKAVAGALLAIPGVVQAGMSLANLFGAKKAEKGVDKSKLNLKESKAIKEMMYEPLKQSYVEKAEESLGKDFATSMGQVSDPRTKVGLYNRMQAQKSAQDLKLLGLSEEARKNALRAKADFDTRKGMFEAQQAQRELENIGEAKGAAQQSLMNVIGDTASLISSGAFKGDGKGLFGGRDKTTKTKIDKTFNPTGELYEYKDGGTVEAKGGMVTEGEFDHDSNPIDIVQDGEKKGEMTGGELIVPPSDVEDIRKALDGGDAELAMELMKSLVAKYDQNVMEAEGKEAQDGGTVPPLKEARAKEIVKVMDSKLDVMRNLGEMPQGDLMNYMTDMLSFNLDSNTVAENDFIKNYREHLINKHGRSDSDKK